VRLQKWIIALILIEAVATVLLLTAGNGHNQNIDLALNAEDRSGPALADGSDLPLSHRPTVLATWKTVVQNLGGIDYRKAEATSGGLDVIFQHPEGMFTLFVSDISHEIKEIRGNYPGRPEDLLGNRIAIEETLISGGYVPLNPRTVPLTEEEGWAVEFDVFWSGATPRLGGDLCEVTLEDAAGGIIAKRDVPVFAPLIDAARDGIVYTEFTKIETVGSPQVVCRPWNGLGYVAQNEAGFSKNAPDKIYGVPFGDATRWVSQDFVWRGDQFPATWRCIATVWAAEGDILAQDVVIIPGTRVFESTSLTVDIPVELPRADLAADYDIVCNLYDSELEDMKGS